MASASNGVTATLTVGFNRDTAAISEGMTAMVDDRPDGLNGGKTSFEPGDEVGILLFVPSTITYLGFVTSADGSPGFSMAPATPATAQYVVENEMAAFIDEKEASVQKPIDSAFTKTWMGVNLGELVKKADTVLALSSPPVKPDAMPANEFHYAGIATIGYTSEAMTFMMQSPDTLGGETEFDIQVIFFGYRNP